MKYVIDTDTIKADAFDDIVDIKNGTNKRHKVKEVMKFTKGILLALHVYGVPLDEYEE